MPVVRDLKVQVNDNININEFTSSFTQINYTNDTNKIESVSVNSETSSTIFNIINDLKEYLACIY